MSLTETLIQAALTAPEERKAAALKVLRGEAVDPPPREPDRFITLVECARRLGVSACSLWRWGVPGHELGGRRKFRMSEVEAYLESEEFRKRAADLREQDRARRGKSLAGAKTQRGASDGREVTEGRGGGAGRVTRDA